MTVVLDGETLTVDEVVAVARDDERVEIAPEARERVRLARERVEDVVDAGDAVYGINTGFGDLVDSRIPADRLAELQRNLLRSHAAGTGEPLARELVRATMLTRINALVKGYSGVREVVVDHLETLLNEGVHPVVPRIGSLGASGDLAPLAYVALVLIGEGEATVDRDGGTDRIDGESALEAAGLEALTLQAKEGLALINGTQLSLGVAALLVHDAAQLCRAADAAGGLTTEVTMGTTVSAHPAIHEARPHRGQQISARTVRQLTADSDVVESHRNCDRVQDAYSIRCLPQVHGAVRDAVAHLRDAVAVELNSATDNPLVFPGDAVGGRASGTDSAAVLSGGNFHGEVLALRLDYLVGALTELAAISERRADRICNPHVQESYLSPFLATDSGVESGLMIAQYTAAACLSECRSLGRAASDNTPVSGGTEDHVSMSATAAFRARETLERARTAIAIELLCGAEAFDHLVRADLSPNSEDSVLDSEDDHSTDDLSLGVGTEAVYEVVREVVDPLDGDRRLDGDIAAVGALVERGVLDDAVAERLDGGWPAD